MPPTYRVLGHLGRGGMGVVDLAETPDGTKVALKRVALAGSAAEMTVARARIRREAEVLQQLRHPGIVPLIEVAEAADGELVLVMPYLPGGDLANRIATHGPLDPDQVTRLADHLLAALAAAHRQGIVHRDVKPANVLFDGDGRPYLADFGIATARDLTSGLTMPGTVLGTPGFLSPEQARGEPATAASDLYSLGATLLYAITGQEPGAGKDRAVQLADIANARRPTLPRGFPERDRLLGMLEPDPRHRPTAAQLRPGPAGTDPGFDRPPKPRRRLRLASPATPARWRWLLAGIVVVALTGFVAGMVLSNRGDGTAISQETTTTTPTTIVLQCRPGTADLDGDPTNGCEARADEMDGTVFRDRITANLVPADDVDEYPMPVEDRLQLLCDGKVTVTLTPPPGAVLRLEILLRQELVGSAVGEATNPAEVRVGDPDCVRDNAATYTVRVSSVGPSRTGEPYVLERRGTL